MAPPSSEINYVHRETGELRAERVYGERELRLLYETWWGSALLHAFIKRQWFSHVSGILRRSPFSRREIPAFVQRYEIDDTESEFPAAAYQSLDAFFTRKLKPEARPIDRNPLHLVAPAEGRVLAFAEMPGGQLDVKGCTVDIEELVGGLNGFKPGAAFVIRLAPCDYHRFHFPTDCQVADPVGVGRTLHSVHPIALRAGTPAFRNKRMVSMLSNTKCGRLLQVEVGALTVGSIVQTYDRGPVKKGQEKGYFRLGGSTVILLTEPGRVAPDADLLDATARGLETLVKVNTRIGLIAGS
jgi:phosphatidylserine decarboxylase